MKLLLHIGTHKTASTSIQHFCALNHTTLEKHGYFYPKNKHSAYVANHLASRLAFGKYEEPTKFLHDAYIQAKKKNCHTVIISAESFYAMTAFFIDIPKRPRPIADYWDMELSLIEKLHDFCADYDKTSIVTYFRPQDGFAASLYNQFVKNSIGISASFEEFLQTVTPIFDYERHINLWTKTFGVDNVSVNDFRACKTDSVKDFAEKYLSPKCYEEAGKTEHHANEKLPRDILEFKRTFNATKPDRYKAYVALKCFQELAKDIEDKSGYQTFASTQYRNDFFSSFVSGNEALSMKYNLGDFPTMVDNTEPSYPGLASDKQSNLNNRLQIFLTLPKNRYEIALRQFINKLTDKVPVTKIFLAPLRILNNQLRLRFSGW